MLRVMQTQNVFSKSMFLEYALAKSTLCRLISGNVPYVCSKTI
jgi:hypothetical protein